MIPKEQGNRNKNTLRKRVEDLSEADLDSMFVSISKITDRMEVSNLTQDLNFDEELLTDEEAKLPVSRRFIAFDKTESISEESIDNKFKQSEASTYKDFIQFTDSLREGQKFMMGSSETEKQLLTEDYKILEVLKVGNSYVSLQIEDFDYNNKTRLKKAHIQGEHSFYDFKNMNHSWRSNEKFMSLAEKIAEKDESSIHEIQDVFKALKNVNARQFSDAIFIGKKNFDMEDKRHPLHEESISRQRIHVPYDEVRDGFLFENGKKEHVQLKRFLAKEFINHMSEDQAKELNQSLFSKTKKATFGFN